VFSARCAQAGIEVSMGSIAESYDNAVCEAFHASLKRERINRRPWPTRAEARNAVFEYIEGWYNPRPAALRARLPLARRVRASAPRPSAHRRSRGRLSIAARGRQPSADDRPLEAATLLFTATHVETK
jgi:hypothetical protein